MSERIHPRQLKEPYDLHQIEQCIESWRGVPHRKVPVEVKVLAAMMEKLDALTTFASYQAQKRLATEEVLEYKRMRDADHAQREAERLKNWPQDVKVRLSRNRLHEACNGSNNRNGNEARA